MVASVICETFTSKKKTYPFFPYPRPFNLLQSKNLQQLSLFQFCDVILTHFFTN